MMGVAVMMVIVSGVFFWVGRVQVPVDSMPQSSGAQAEPRHDNGIFRVVAEPDTATAGGPSGVAEAGADFLPVPVEDLPGDLPKRVAFVVGKMREYQLGFQPDWRVPDEFRISPANAERLVAEYRMLAEADADAECQYRDAHHDFIRSEVAAGRAMLTEKDVNQAIGDLERAGRYDPARDHLGIKAGFDKGNYIVLSKRGATPALDPHKEYCESISAVYSESLRALLGYMAF